MRECRSLGVREPGVLAFFDLPVPPPADGGVLVRTRYSGLSTGTELSYVKGTDPGAIARHDRDLGVFLPEAHPRRYPIQSMGYMEVGEVVESRRPGLEPGMLVAAAYGHRSWHAIAPGSLAVPLPAGVDPVLGVYLAHMGPICANGVLHAAAEERGREVSGLGDGVRGRHVLVTGAGVVGLLTGLFARLHGAAAVAVADPDPARLAVAEALGLLAVDERHIEPWRWCKERWVHGPADRGADVVFQCRGRAGVLHEALRTLRPQGVVIDLAFYQGGSEDLRLGEEFHHNGLTIRCAQISRVPRGLADRWDRRRLAEETAALLASDGHAVRDHLVTDVLPIEQAPEFVADLAARRRSAMTAVFTYDDTPPVCRSGTPHQ